MLHSVSSPMSDGGAPDPRRSTGDESDEVLQAGILSGKRRGETVRQL